MVAHSTSSRTQPVGLRADVLIALALVLSSFLLYLRTLAPDVVDADGGEFQFAAWNFSFAHPTGYPLFLILGGMFQHLLPIGNPAYRLNLFTALTAALAVGTLYFVVKEITVRRGAALTRVTSVIAAASFAVTRTFWYDASAAEAYDLNAFFIALLIFLELRWQASVAPSRGKVDSVAGADFPRDVAPATSVKTFAMFCFAYGLALTHHRAIILWLPAFGLFSLLVVRQARLTFDVSRFVRHFFLFTFSFSLPLSLYLYVPLRAPASPYAVLPLAPGRDIALYDNSLNGFINYILGRGFQSEIGWDAASVARLCSVPQLLLDQFGAMGVALGIVGFIAMAWRREWARLVLLTGFVTTVLFASVYHIGDIWHYYIPAYLAWAVWSGVGLSAVVVAISRPLTADRRLPSELDSDLRSIVGGLLAIFLVLPQLVVNYSTADRSRETGAREQWTRILAAPIPQNAIVISNDRDEMMPLWYMQYVENTRRDVLGLFPLITPAAQHANIARLTDSVLGAGRPVFFIKPMPGIEIKYRVAASDSLVRVLGRTADASPQSAAVGANGRPPVLADRVRVLGYAVAREPGSLSVAIYWVPLAKLDRDYTTFVHLLDARGNKVAQGNDHQVGGEFYPTSLWDIGETLRDEQVIELPPNLTPGNYRLLAGMYLRSEFGMLGEPVEIGMVELK